MITVYNLATDATVTYEGLPPRSAVIAAYAQHLPQQGTTGDFNTWDYEANYGHMVETGRTSYLCGDWAAAKE